jgi:hypothetical protein
MSKILRLRYHRVESGPDADVEGTGKGGRLPEHAVRHLSRHVVEAPYPRFAPHAPVRDDFWGAAIDNRGTMATSVPGDGLGARLQSARPCGLRGGARACGARCSRSHGIDGCPLLAHSLANSPSSATGTSAAIPLDHPHGCFSGLLCSPGQLRFSAIC